MLAPHRRGILQSAPIIAPGLNSYNIVPTDSLTIPCEVDAQPKANILWLKNGEPIEKPAVDIEDGALVIEKATEAARGM